MNKAEINDLRNHALYDQIKTSTSVQHQADGVSMNSISERLEAELTDAQEAWDEEEPHHAFYTLKRILNEVIAHIRQQEARIAELESISLEQIKIKIEGGTADELVNRATVLNAFNELIAELEKAEGVE